VTPTIEPAREADLDAIRAVLSAGGLPVEDVNAHIESFVLARWQSATIGTIALQQVGEAALLRSLCVVAQYRGHAVGTRLLSAIEERAVARGIRELYLLTTSAADFFAQHGFSVSVRTAAPPGILGTEQFRTLCPATAVCMRRILQTTSTK